MAETDDLNALGQPVLDLPEDLGDGPFWTTPSAQGTSAKAADTTELFRRTEPFEDNFITDNPILGPSPRITVGRFHVSDQLRPNSFRRVHQSITHRPSPELDGTFEIRFTGAGIAVMRQATHATQGVSDAAVGKVAAIGNALMALDDEALIPRPTMYAASTTFSIRLRIPGYEPTRHGGIVVPDPTCIDTGSNLGRRLLKANRIEEFTFGNSARERKIIEIPFPVGQSIPVVFDIVNHMPSHRITVDFFVEILINRTEQNESKARASNVEETIDPQSHARSPVVPAAQNSSARIPGSAVSIRPGNETHSLDEIAARGFPREN